jgi:N-acetylgalactosamine-6-sulfatase
VNSLTRRHLIAAGAAAALRGQTPRPPNMIFILADDMGWGDPSCYGNQRIKTPGLDRIASEGTLFTQFYVNGPVCSPSRTAFLTGRYPARHRVHGHFATPELNEKRGMPNFLDPAVPTLPRLLKTSGYATAHFGKWHLGRGPGAPLPDAYGFDEHKSVTSNESRWQEMEPGFRAKSSAWIVDNALEFIGKNRERPFYTQLWTLLPHAPLAPTEEQLAPFSRFAPDASVPHKSAAQIYLASLADLDGQIARLLARLDKLDLAENTLVLFSSDNGPEDIHIRNASHSAYGSPGPFRGRKRSLYEGGVRVPFLARWPGRIGARRVEDRSVVSAVDFLPTLARLAGVAPPRELDGEDMSGVLLGKPRSRTTPLMWEWRFNVAGYNVNRSPMLSIRDGDWKLLMNPDRSRVELFRIPDDPIELNNLADRHPDIVKRLAERVLAWQKTLPAGPSDPSAGKNDYPWPRAR